MTDAPDAWLLEQFAKDGSEEAFAALVGRHIGLVHSVALRHTANPQQAEDITQAVFIILARKAGALGRKTVLPGWLYHTARLTAANLQRSEWRRIHREQEAYMQSTLEEAPTHALWSDLGPQIDEAMTGLGATERDALVMRYFQNKSMAQVAESLGVAENTAQKRVGRALDKLQKFFAKRGIHSSTETIAESISTNSIQPVSLALAKSVTAAALAKGATATSSTLTLVKGALKLMAWTKTQTVIVASVAVALLGGGAGIITTETIHAVRAAHYPDIQGTWEGVMLLDAPGVANGAATQTHVVLKLVKRNGAYTATTDWIEMGRKDVPMGKVVYDYPSLEIDWNPLRRQIWQLTMNADATQMIMSYTIHMVQPEQVMLTRTTTPDLVPEPLMDEDFAPRRGSDLQGYWEGQLGTGPDALPVDLKIAQQTDGTFLGEGDNPMQGMDSQPLTISYTAPTVNIALATGAGMFQGQINDADTEISGTWTQDGQTVPAIIKRADYQAEHAHDADKDYSFASENDLQGHWRGTWIASFNQGAVKVPIRMALDIAKLPDGTYSVTMADVDQFGYDAPIPASDFQFTPPDFQAEWTWAGGSFGSDNSVPSYVGKLENGKLIGTWNQSGAGHPLVFERSP
jgi:RNA polymerase sigma factor (sigma-70 family)